MKKEKGTITIPEAYTETPLYRSKHLRGMTYKSRMGIDSKIETQATNNQRETYVDTVRTSTIEILKSAKDGGGKRSDTPHPTFVTVEWRHKEKTRKKTREQRNKKTTQNNSYADRKVIKDYSLKPCIFITIMASINILALLGIIAQTANNKDNAAIMAFDYGVGAVDALVCMYFLLVSHCNKSNADSRKLSRLSAVFAKMLGDEVCSKPSHYGTGNLATPLFTNRNNPQVNQTTAIIHLVKQILMDEKHCCEINNELDIKASGAEELVTSPHSTLLNYILPSSDINNYVTQGRMVQHGDNGFSLKLTLGGGGYRTKVLGKALNLSLGSSHPVNIEMPGGVTVETPTQTEVVVKGADKQKVSQTEADIRHSAVTLAFDKHYNDKVEKLAEMIVASPPFQQNSKGTIDYSVV